MGRTGIAELALEGGMVGADKLEHARRNARGTGDQALAHSMLSLGHISENQYVSLLSRHLSLPLVKLVEETIDPQAPHLLQEDFVRRHNALPIRIEDDELTVEFWTHACCEITAGGHRIVTDPWLVGPAFSRGWWLAHEPPADWR